MHPRTLAGLGMTLLAAGLLTLFFLTYDRTPGGKGGDPQGIPPAIAGNSGGPQEVDAWLAEYNATYRGLWTAAESANWDAESNISEANTTRRIAAAGALARFAGSRPVIERLRDLRGRTDLDELQEHQVAAAWRLAAHGPVTAGAAVERLIATQAVLIDSLYAFDYRLSGPGGVRRVVTPNEIDDLLLSSRDLAERRAVWECSKSVGPRLKDGVETLQGLRNQVAREMGFSSFFDLEVADYGLTADEMIGLMDELIAGIMPLYRQLHCWVKYELAARYGAPVPDLIPAHWLGNRWGQEWPGIVEGIDLDAPFAEVQPQWLVQQAEGFYVSLGFEPLPATFWERSDLYELPPGSQRRKNTHASAWHIDLDRDVRSLMSVRPNFSWFQTTHHELGHVYYYLAYSRPEVPPILRRGTNRAFHEGIGTLAELACSQVPYLQQVGMLAPAEAPDQIRWLLTQALQGPVVFIPFACGTMTHWEYDLYEGELPRHHYNTRWWEYAARYQGVAPPAPRGEDYCDPATKTHIIDDPAQYYDYALSAVILHQLHRFICREILDQDVRSANYFGSKPVGRYLESILQVGATRDWELVMRQATGEELSSEALLEYFAPLQAWLAEQNAGRVAEF